MIKIITEEGKYTFLHDEDHGGITILRYDEPWRNETGDKALLSLLHRINKLEETNCILREDKVSNLSNKDLKESMNFRKRQ